MTLTSGAAILLHFSLSMFNNDWISFTPCIPVFSLCGHLKSIFRQYTTKTGIIDDVGPLLYTLCRLWDSKILYYKIMLALT